MRAACAVRKNGQTGRPSVGNGCRFVCRLHRRGRTARIVGAAAGEMDTCAVGAAFPAGREGVRKSVRPAADEKPLPPETDGRGF